MVSRIAEKLLALIHIAFAGVSVWLHAESVLSLCLTRSVSPSYPNETQDYQNVAECLPWFLQHLVYLPTTTAKVSLTLLPTGPFSSCPDLHPSGSYHDVSGSCCRHVNTNRGSDFVLP